MQGALKEFREQKRRYEDAGRITVTASENPWSYMTAGAPPEKASAPTARPSPDSILIEAEELVHGARNEAYGAIADNMEDIAALWSVVLGHAVTAREASLCMCLLKIAREKHVHTRDNLVDLAGYAFGAQACAEKEAKP